MKRISLVLGMIICSQLLSACSDQGGSKQNAPVLPQEQVQGTGDGGGGNAINFKMLESHIIDPTTLAVVKNRLLPMLEKSFPGNEKKDLRFFDIKTWYLAPISLKQLPKEVLGIEFTQDRIQQIAIQTDREIWIDANLFKQMNEEEQARLILHEFLMGVYMMRFKNLPDMCEVTLRMGSKCEFSGDMKEIEEIFKPEPLRRLNEKDYNIIRTMTAWFFQNENQLSEKSYEEASTRFGFKDPRTTTKHDSDNLPEDERKHLNQKLSAEQFMVLLKEVELSKRLNTNCYGLKTNQEVPCTVEFQFEKNTDAMTSFIKAFVTMNLKDKKTGAVIQSARFDLHEQSGLSVMTTTLNSPTHVASSANLYSQEGARTTMVYFDLSRNSYDDSYKISAITTIPVVNAGSYTEEKKSDDGRDQKCVKTTIAMTEPTVFQEDMISLADSEATLKEAKRLKMMKMGGSTTCSFVTK